jgi:hypothetical protein
MTLPQLGIDAIAASATGNRKFVNASLRLRPDLVAVRPTRSPAGVTLRKASGGFNCVVELSADSCRRVFSLGVDAPSFDVPIATSQLRDFIDEHAGELSEPIRNLEIEDRPSYDLLIGFGAPSALEFEDPHRVKVTYQGRVKLAKVDRPPRKPGKSRRLPVRVVPEIPTYFSKLGIGIAPIAAAAWRNRPPRDGETTIVADLGRLTLTVSCNYFRRLEADFARCDVLASLWDADADVSLPPGDGTAFVERFIGAEATTLLSQLQGPAAVKLTPTISVTGRNPASATVDEFSECDANAFHVELGDEQAMAVAFDLMPGCHGVIEDVEHFLCGHDYGVISDEWVIAGVLRHKWHLGGFYRQLSSTRDVRIERDGDEEDAGIHFDLALDGLEVVSLETDANTRTDFLRLGGPATATPRYLQLADGSQHSPDETGLGGPSSQSWTVFTSPTLDPQPSGNWQEERFQQHASTDAYRHLARPFAAFPEEGVDVGYTRLEGVEKHMFCLGDCEEAFL